MARRWVQEGATYLHLVDLDGAREGRPVNGESIQRIVQAAGAPCQLGGGLRTETDVEQALAWGIDRVVIGTRALQDPEGFAALCQRFAGKVVAGIDARDGRVASEGWLAVSSTTAIDLARRLDELPLAAIVYTDISRDGMLQGPNFAAMAELVAAVSVPVIASGGVTTLADIRRLAGLGLAGCIVGRALYEGRLQLPDVLREANLGKEGGRPASANAPRPPSTDDWE